MNAHTVVLPNENADEYTSLLHSYIQDLQPSGPVERDLIIEMVNAKWRQRRLCDIENGLFEQELEKQKESVAHAFAFRTLSESGSLAMLRRMESRLERTYSRALNTLLRLRRLRESNLDAGKQKGEKRTESQERTPGSNLVH